MHDIRNAFTHMICAPCVLCIPCVLGPGIFFGQTLAQAVGKCYSSEDADLDTQDVGTSTAPELDTTIHNYIGNAYIEHSYNQ